MKLSTETKHQLLKEQVIESSFFLTKSKIKGDIEAAQMWNQIMITAIEQIKNLKHGNS